MLKSIQRAELTLFDFVYTPYPSYSFAICNYQTCYNKYTKSVENCGNLWKYVDNCSSSVRFTKCLYKESMHKKIP